MECDDGPVLETSARLLRLLSLLQARPEWSGPELADRLGVTTRTVRRDVDRLRHLGYPVDSAPGPTGGGYRLGAGGALPPLLLDDDEAVAITVGLQGGATAAGLDDAAASALRKLDQVLPPRLRQRVAALAATTVPLATTPAAAVDADTLVTLAQACRGSVRVRFTYTDGGRRRSERTAEPHRLVHTGRRWYLVARDVRRDDWRTFRVDRITDPQATGHTFVLDDPPDAAALVSRAVSVSPYRHRAVVKIHAPAAELAERVPPTVGVVEAVDDTTSLLTTGADHLDSIALHCAALGFELEVVEPVELRQRLADLAERIGRAATR